MKASAATRFECSEQDTFELFRFPRRRRELLQAWDAADRYLLRELHAMGPKKPQRSLVVNDAFGALTLGLRQDVPDVWLDDVLAELSLQENYQHNFGEPYGGQMIPSTQQPGGPYERVVMKVPRDHDYFMSQLVGLKDAIHDRTTILAGLMAKDLHGKLLERINGVGLTVECSLAWKKARILRIQAPKGWQPSLIAASSFRLPEFGIEVRSFPGVFSGKKPDVGGRLLADVIPQNRRGMIVDCGCGNGMVAAVAAQKNPDAHILAVDVSRVAVASAEMTFHSNDLLREDHRFRAGDCLEGVEDDCAHLILCNPPFHQGQALDSGIADRMFAGARRVLKKDGEFYVVGNRHLQYHVKLKRYFSQVELVGKHPKFVRFKCRLPVR